MPDIYAPIRIFQKQPDDKMGSSVAFTASGLLLFATKNQIVEANVITGKIGRTFTAGKVAIVCFALASSAHRLAALADDGTVILWDTATGRRLHVFKLRDGNSDSRAEYDVAISPNGRYLAVCGSGVVRVCDLVTGQIRKAFHFLYAAVFSPDGRTLFLGGARRFQAWDVLTWQPTPPSLRKLGDFMTHPTYTSIDCSPDGRWIAGAVDISRADYTILAVNDSKTLKDRWDAVVSDGEFIDGVSKVVYSPSGNLIAVGINFQDGYFKDIQRSAWLRLYSAENGKSSVYYEMKKTIRSIAFSKDGKYIAVVTDSVTVWSVIS